MDFWNKFVNQENLFSPSFLPRELFASFPIFALLLLQEFCVKKKDRVEVLAMLGLFGALVSVIEMYPLIKECMGSSLMLRVIS